MNRLLNTVVVFSAFLACFVSIAAMNLLSSRRDDRISSLAATSEWARYESAVAACVRSNVVRDKQNRVVAELHKLIPGFDVFPTELVDCDDVVSKPVSPRPKGTP